MEDAALQKDDGDDGIVSAWQRILDRDVPTTVLDYLLERVGQEPDDPILAEALRGELIDMIRKLQSHLTLIMENRDELEKAAPDVRPVPPQD